MDTNWPSGQDPYRIQKQFQLPFGIRRLSPLEIHLMPRDYLLDPNIYLLWVYLIAQQQNLSRRKWYRFIDIVNRYKGKLFHLDGTPFEFDDVREYFTIEMEWFGRFIRPNEDNTGPAHHKGDDIRVAIVELTLRLRRIEAYQHMVNMKRQNLLTPEIEQRMLKMLFNFPPERHSEPDEEEPDEDPADNDTTDEATLDDSMEDDDTKKED